MVKTNMSVLLKSSGYFRVNNKYLNWYKDNEMAPSQSILILKSE